MKKAAVKIKDWPFEKEEKAKLSWIGEPFKDNNKWMFYAYFKGNKSTRKIMLDWASIHFLSVDKHYTDGNLNNGEVLENEDIMNINLTGIKAEYIERGWEIWNAGFVDKTKSKTFNFYKGGTLYTIPMIEIIRAALAPDKFMLYRTLEMGALENFFTYEMKDNELDIFFTSEYEKVLLRDEKINHIAWMLTNPAVLKMVNDIGRNIWKLGELKFDFLFDNFNMKARVHKNKSHITVLEIISLKNKRINVNEINVYHPSLEGSQTIGEAKKKKYIGSAKGSNMELDSGADGSTKNSEEIDTALISHEYERLPRINKMKSGRKVRRKIEDENTKAYNVQNGQARTLADAGGERLLQGLEFTSIANVEEKGELGEFIEILKLLEERHAVRNVEIIIGELPEGIKGKRFSKLSDGITKRKYAIGKITMTDGRECSLIEIEREDKALSMLILTAQSIVNWDSIYSRLLLGLVDESGKWSNSSIERVERQGVVVYRNKHIKREFSQSANYIYEKLNST